MQAKVQDVEGFGVSAKVSSLGLGLFVVKV